MIARETQRNSVTEAQSRREENAGECVRGENTLFLRSEFSSLCLCASVVQNLGRMVTRTRAASARRRLRR